MDELREEYFGLHRGKVFFLELEAIQPLKLCCGMTNSGQCLYEKVNPNDRQAFPLGQQFNGRVKLPPPGPRPMDNSATWAFCIIPRCSARPRDRSLFILSSPPRESSAFSTMGKGSPPWDRAILMHLSLVSTNRIFAICIKLVVLLHSPHTRVPVRSREKRCPWVDEVRALGRLVY